MPNSEILYIHAKRSTRIEPVHWLFDSASRTTIGTVKPLGDGWKINLYDGVDHPVLQSIDDMSLC